MLIGPRMPTTNSVKNEARPQKCEVNCGESSNVDHRSRSRRPLQQWTRQQSETIFIAAEGLRALQILDQALAGAKGEGED